MTPEVLPNSSLEFVRSKMQRPIYSTGSDGPERRHIGITKAVATHGVSVPKFAAVALAGKFLGSELFATPNTKNPSLKRHEIHEWIGEVTVNPKPFNPLDVSEEYADGLDENENIVGGFVVAFNSLLLDAEKLDAFYDDDLGVPELIIAPSPGLDVISKIYPLDDQSKNEFDRIIHRAG